MMKIGFGGGCHWCTEAVFLSLKGVHSVGQGWISAADDRDNFSEAVLISFDPVVIALATLIEIHLCTHSSTTMHRYRPKYRSAIYIFSAEQQSESLNALTQLQRSFDDQIITRVLTFHQFRENDQKYLNYYFKHPEAPFCRRYIDPKLQLLRERFSKVTDNKSSGS